jgi:hypothetical protein
MTSHIQSGLLRTAACLLAILPVNAWAQVQNIQGVRGYSIATQAPVRINPPQSRGPNSPQVEESGPRPQGAQDTYRSRRGDGNYRGPDGNRGPDNNHGDRSNIVQPNNPNIADRGRQQTDGDGDRGRDGRSDYRRGRDGWASPRYDGRGRYDDYGRGGYARGARFAGAYGGRYPAYRGWGWAQGGYASPVIVISPVGYRGWARNYPFSTPIVVLPAYGGWAAGPAYPVRRRR